MDLTVGQIVWARRNQNDIYWPGKITIISNNTNDLWSSELHYNYLVQFFVTNQSIWITDILPYRQYKDSMTNDSFMNYGLHPTIKQDFLNAINQADSAINNELYTNSNHLTSMTMMTTTQQQKLLPIIEDNTDNDFLLTPTPMFTSNTEYYNSPYQQSFIPTSNSTIQSLDTFPKNSNTNSNKTTQSLTTNNDWYTQQGLIVESITPPLPSQDDNQMEYISSLDNFQKTDSIIIITTKTSSNSSFISYLFNCFTNSFHHSIIYIDDLTINYQHPNTSNIYYLICLDYFDSNIKQILNSTILNNLNAHINYLFLVLNAPSHELVKHLYSIIMDKRTILILHYHSTFDNEPLLLCSGNRITFEMIRSTLLKCLCSKIKYIESQGDEEEEFYSMNNISFRYQSNNIKNEPMVDTPNHTFLNYSNISNEYLAASSIMKHSKKLSRRKLITTLGKKNLKRKFKERLSKNGMVSVLSSEYRVKNILDTFNSSK